MDLNAQYYVYGNWLSFCEFCYSQKWLVWWKSDGLHVCVMCGFLPYSNGSGGSFSSSLVSVSTQKAPVVTLHVGSAFGGVLPVGSIGSSSEGSESAGRAGCPELMTMNKNKRRRSMINNCTGVALYGM